jgi:hypothetical protein
LKAAGKFGESINFTPGATSRLPAPPTTRKRFAPACFTASISVCGSTTVK